MVERFARAALGLALLMLVPLLAHAAPPDETDLRKAVHYALQCNATIGTIEDVTLSAPVTTDTVRYVLRGMYRQRIGGVSFLGLQSPEALGGVFDGVYDSGAHKLRSLTFKIGPRTGAVTPSCLK